jgi:hypothetical protein
MSPITSSSATHANDNRLTIIEPDVHRTTITTDIVLDRVTYYLPGKLARNYEAVQGAKITIGDYITNPLLGAVGLTILLMRVMSRLSDAFPCYCDHVIEKAFPVNDLMPTLPTTIDPRKHIDKCMKACFT